MRLKQMQANPMPISAAIEQTTPKQNLA